MDAQGTAYEVLGLDAGCSDEQIQTAYRELAKLTHPDRGGDPIMFDVLSDAYEKIETPFKRAAYDRTIAPPSRQSPGRPSTRRRSRTPAGPGAPGCLTLLVESFIENVLIGTAVISVILIWILWVNHPVAGVVVTALVLAALLAAIRYLRR